MYYPQKEKSNNQIPFHTVRENRKNAQSFIKTFKKCTLLSDAIIDLNNMLCPRICFYGAVYYYTNRNDLISVHMKTIRKNYKNKDHEHERDNVNTIHTTQIHRTRSK